MPYIIEEKIKAGISACNFGALVRYNRRGWDKLEAIGREKDAFIWTPVCPESMSGLGVPRPPMKLVDGNGDDFWKGKAKMKNRSGQNVSQNIKDGALMAMENLKRAGVETFVFMDGSPSCGVYRTTLKNQRLGKPPGVFGSLLLKENFFLIPALDLDSPVKWWDWRRRLHAFVWLKRKNISTVTEMVEVWHRFKYLSQESSRAQSDAIGRRIANISKNSQAEDLLEIKNEIMSVLRLPSNIRRIKASIEKQMSFLCKKTGVCYPEKLPSTESGKRNFFNKLIELEKETVLKNIDFGFAPVIYRERRS